MNGYSGRIPIHEVLLINEDIRDAISNNIKKDELKALVYKDAKTLLQDGLLKVSKGLTTFEEIIRLIELDVEDVVIERFENQEVDENGQPVVKPQPTPVQPQPQTQQ